MTGEPRTIGESAQGRLPEHGSHPPARHSRLVLPRLLRSAAHDDEVRSADVGALWTGRNGAQVAARGTPARPGVRTGCGATHLPPRPEPDLQGESAATAQCATPTARGIAASSRRTRRALLRRPGVRGGRRPRDARPRAPVVEHGYRCAHRDDRPRFCSRSSPTASTSCSSARAVRSRSSTTATRWSPGTA